VTADGGRVLADQAILATLLPVTAAGGFFAKTYPSRSYALAARVEEAAPDGMLLSVETPTRSVRPGPAGDEALLVVEGEEHETGQDDDTRDRYAALESWVRDTYRVRAIEHRWSAQDYMSPDRVPYVGRASDGARRLLVATGFGKWGLSNGTAAAMMLSELALGRDHPWLAVFDSTRRKPGSSTAELVRENLDVARRFVADRLAGLRAPSLAELAPGEGSLVSHAGETLAASRDEGGGVRAFSPRCTHLGCLVAWNTAERTWDCPCHGSRFDHEGRVIEGPAVQDLERARVEDASA
jgi:Rieske Fe-S protein